MYAYKRAASNRIFNVAQPDGGTHTHTHTHPLATCVNTTTQVAEGVKEGKEGVEAHKDDVTALMVAALGGWTDVVKALLQVGQDMLMGLRG